MDCTNPKNPLEFRALGTALGQILSSSHVEGDYAKVFCAIFSNDDEAQEELGINIYEPYEDEDMSEIAGRIGTLADDVLDDLMWAYEQGKKDGALSKSKPSDYVVEFLSIAGIEVNEDCDQPGMFCWKGCETSYHTKEEALSAALLEAVSRVMGFADLSDEFWESLSDTQRLDVARDVYRQVNEPAVAA